MSELPTGSHMKGFCLQLQLFREASLWVWQCILLSFCGTGNKATEQEGLGLFSAHLWSTRHGAKHLPYVTPPRPLNNPGRCVLVFIPLYLDEETEAQGHWITCLRSYRQEVIEPGTHQYSLCLSCPPPLCKCDPQGHSWERDIEFPYGNI